MSSAATCWIATIKTIISNPWSFQKYNRWWYRQCCTCGSWDGSQSWDQFCWSRVSVSFSVSVPCCVVLVLVLASNPLSLLISLSDYWISTTALVIITSRLCKSKCWKMPWGLAMCSFPAASRLDSFIKVTKTLTKGYGSRTSEDTPQHQHCWLKTMYTRDWISYSVY